MKYVWLMVLVSLSAFGWWHNREVALDVYGRLQKGMTLHANTRS